jgi:hypothetical protein
MTIETDRPYPAREGKLVRHLQEVTPAWLTSLLQNRYPGLVVRDFDVLGLESTHTTKLRLALDLNDVGVAAGLPTQVCLKSNWSEGIKTGDICEREARFYYLAAEALDAPLPRSYYADWDGDGGGRGIVVMEDLEAAGGRFGNAADHLGVDGVAGSLESLASLHGALWGSAVLDDDRMLPRSMDTPVDTEQVIRLFNYLALNLEDPAYQAVLPAWAYETPEQLNFLLDELSAYEQEQAGPLCLVHGDAHQGNSYVGADGRRIWLDFQLARRGTPWRDVNYFMIGALTIDERRGNDRALFAHYRDALVSTGAEGVPDEDDAWEQFRRWTAYGMQCWLGNVDRWGQDGIEIVRRFYAAGDDYDTVALLTAGKRPRRMMTPGEGASPLPPDLQELRDSRRPTGAV